MSELKLEGMLQLGGDLTLMATRVLADGEEILVVAGTSEQAHCSTAAPVLLPPTAPSDPGTNVWVNNSFNRTVKIGDKFVVAGGTCVQGNGPTWPGLLLPGSSKVLIRGVPVGVAKKDQAIILANGAAVAFDLSGQS